MSIQLVLAIVVIAALAFTTLRYFQQARNLRARYSSIIDTEAELAAAKNLLEQTKRDQTHNTSNSGHNLTRNTKAR